MSSSTPSKNDSPTNGSPKKGTSKNGTSKNGAPKIDVDNPMNCPDPAQASTSEGATDPVSASAATGGSAGAVSPNIRKRRSPNKPQLELPGTGPEVTDATQEVPQDETSEPQPTPPFGRDPAESNSGTLVATAQQPTGKNEFTYPSQH